MVWAGCYPQPSMRWHVPNQALSPRLPQNLGRYIKAVSAAAKWLVGAVYRLSACFRRRREVLPGVISISLRGRGTAINGYCAHEIGERLTMGWESKVNRQSACLSVRATAYRGSWRHVTTIAESGTPAWEGHRTRTSGRYTVQGAAGSLCAAHQQDLWLCVWNAL